MKLPFRHAEETSDPGPNPDSLATVLGRDFDYYRAGRKVWVVIPGEKREN